MSNAEALISMTPEAFAAAISGKGAYQDIFAAARIAGTLAAKKTGDIIPLSAASAPAQIAIEFEAQPIKNAIIVKASVAGDADLAAILAANIAALTLYDAVRPVDRNAVIEVVRLSATTAASDEQNTAHRSIARLEGPDARPARAVAKPSTLMGEVAAPRASAGPSSQREAFRAFMTSRHLRATQWGKDAGVPSAQILAFLTGRLRALPADVAERLAKAARARVEDMFR
jgi:cyclic pyranopterin phosphate synthase